MRLLELREFDVERRALVPRFSTDGASARFAPAARREPAGDELERWLAFCQAGRIEVHAAPSRSGLGALLHARGASAPVVCGPLRGDAQPLGVALFELDGARAPDAAELACAAALLEPLATALQNATRERAQHALRETAEADRRSLLARLGRTEIAETIVGTEGGLREVMERLALVAASDLPVLLLGETGSGKEIAARAIHGRSPRRERPFLRVNCGAIPAQLIDSELFGHERGSFTGATGSRAGWFERADTGTLFLDEIGELPLEAQVRLLRVLQDGTFERVGGQQGLRVDVRIVAATHRDLAAMVEREQFRRDLWYRIAVFPVHLPPLRERPEDLPALATHFALKAARRLGIAPQSPTREDLDLLAGYDWPGNIRELASVMERAVLLGGGARLAIGPALGVGGGEPRRASEVQRAPRRDAEQPAQHGAPPHFPHEARGAAPPLARSGPPSRRELEDALRRSLGRVEGPFGAAAALGLNPNTLRSRLARLGVDASAYRKRARR
ncbi:MAG: hypothetical protein EPO68_08325 [Planctomycetota bacterium]|nr:MAG: hypothetical protein EPO68_08325 [Planctomycetota bacterium]